MKRSAKRVATKWLIENVNSIKSDQIPEEVIVSLCAFGDDDLYDLASQVIWNWLVNKFVETVDDKDSTAEYTEHSQEEIDKFVDEYRKNNFPQYKKLEHFMDAYVTRVAALFSTLCMRHRGLIRISEFDFWDVIEGDIACFRGKASKKKVLSPVESDAREKDMKEAVFELLNSGNRKQAQELLRKYKLVIERLND